MDNGGIVLMVSTKDCIFVVLIISIWYYYIYQSSYIDDFDPGPIDDMLLDSRHLSILYNDIIVLVASSILFLFTLYIPKYIYPITGLSILRDQKLKLLEKKLSKTNDPSESLKLRQKIKNLKNHLHSFSARIFSFVHAIIVTCLVIYAMIYVDFDSDYFIGEIGGNYITGTILAFSSGFFVVDIILTVVTYSHGGFLYLSHAIMGFILCFESMVRSIIYHK